MTKQNEDQRDYVVCVTKECRHTPESVLMLCGCGREIWVSPWNLDKKFICIVCFRKLKDVEIKINLRDQLRAERYIKENE